jgi:hypothetical protein
MAGDLLSIEQICELSGLSERIVKKAISKGDLLDQSPKCVGEWLKSSIQIKMSAPKARIGVRKDRETIVHRKWD